MEEKILVEVLPKNNRISIQVRKETSMDGMSGGVKDEPSSMVVIIHTLDALVEDWYQTKKMVRPSACSWLCTCRLNRVPFSPR